jgi:hypothetical protein
MASVGRHGAGQRKARSLNMKWFDVVSKFVEAPGSKIGKEAGWLIAGFADEIDEQHKSIANACGELARKLARVEETGDLSQLHFVGTRALEEIAAMRAARDANIRALRVAIRLSGAAMQDFNVVSNEAGLQ